jgi:dienelactone hydrolase
MAEPNIAEETLAYRNPLDGTEPLCAFVAYPRLDRPLPLLVVMHGYSQGADRTTVVDVARRFARRYGIIAASLDLRGRGGSAGRRDSSGRETSDIRAACEFLTAHFGYRLDPENLSILGYSGGGGNVFSVLVKCPDLFRSAFSFFGVSDYAYWFDHGAEERHRAQLLEDIGGPPSEFPERYAARSALLGVGNNRQTDIHLFWDAQEKVCPPYFNLAYAERARALGFDNVILHESRPGEHLRWLHGYPGDRPDLMTVEPFVGDCLEDPHVPPVVLDPVGRLTVVGYLITKPFVVLPGSLTDCVLDLTYSVAGEGLALRACGLHGPARGPGDHRPQPVAAADTRGGPRASHDVSATAPGHGAGARRAGARRRRGSAVVEGEAGRDAPGD